MVVALRCEAPLRISNKCRCCRWETPKLLQTARMRPAPKRKLLQGRKARAQHQLEGCAGFGANMAIWFCFAPPQLTGHFLNEPRDWAEAGKWWETENPSGRAATANDDGAPFFAQSLATFWRVLTCEKLCPRRATWVLFSRFIHFIRSFPRFQRNTTYKSCSKSLYFHAQSPSKYFFRVRSRVPTESN